MDAKSKSNVQNSLFRDEALEYASNRYYGTILLSRPIGHRALTVIFGSFAVGIILFLIFFDYTKKENVMGVLVPSRGVIHVTPNQSGTIVSRQVHEGSSVESGDLLFEVNGERLNLMQGSAESAVTDSLKSQRESYVLETEKIREQSEQRINFLKERLYELNQEKDQVNNWIQLQEERIALADASYKRVQSLQSEHLASVAEAQDAKSKLIEQAQRISELKLERATVLQNILSTRADIRDQELQETREQELKVRGIAETDREIVESEVKRRFLVRAPIDGVVVGVSVDRGQAVQVNQTLTMILPKGDKLEAELYVPSKSTGFIKEGMKVLMRYDAYPYQKFGQFAGVVREISGASVRRTLLPVVNGSASDAELDDSHYRIRVSLKNETISALGKEYVLRPGATLEASIELETRSLLEWSLDPFRKIAQRF